MCCGIFFGCAHMQREAAADVSGRRADHIRPRTSA
jgi:hypothetical protein